MVRRTLIVFAAACLTLAVPIAAQAPNVSLPAPAMKAFQQAYPGASIPIVATEREGSRQLYRVDSVDKGRQRSVLYDANGSVVQIAEKVEEKDLPKPVADAMHSHPRAIYVSGLKVTRGSNVEYRLTLRGTRKTAMVAKPDGTVLSFK